MEVDKCGPMNIGPSQNPKPRSNGKIVGREETGVEAQLGLESFRGSDSISGQRPVQYGP